MFYVISKEYVGPGASVTRAPLIVDIRTSPAKTIPGGQPLEKGWLGTANDVAYHAHGAFGTLSAARDFVFRTWPGTGRIGLRREWIGIGGDFGEVVDRYVCHTRTPEPDSAA